MNGEIEVEGERFSVDEEGYLADFREWDSRVAEELARLMDIVLTEAHWEVIRFLREYYEQFRIAPSIRVLVKAIGRKLGPEKGNSAWLHDLFPDGPAKQACKIAGLPKPTGCI